ncbi:hypothetical protein [Parasulfitobacter algicola]|uniref:Uncharacterized protein n=1 Tax=Parasulfitobacter algicola TaxID=2614809 RepID=A0ABX2IQ90_9RHOB|nr:hypothetical protein [Sulfitobacter algicola]NSX53275.1 hypothetical protein [Sulfitobacter algicola]
MTAIASGDFRAKLRIWADWVWSRQEAAFHKGLKLQEETITEMLLLRIAEHTEGLGVHVKMFNKYEEGGRAAKKGKPAVQGNGADWEWFVETPECMVGFRVQAKVLFHKQDKRGGYVLGRYDGLKVGSLQSTDLISMAGDANPIYLFYNHGLVKDVHLFNNSGPPDHFGQTCWGCSVATADFVAAKKSNKLSALIGGMVPWHLFFGIGKTCRTKEAMKTMAGNQSFRRATHRPEWVPMLSDTIGALDEDSRIYLDEFLSERRLEGVAHIKIDE